MSIILNYLYGSIFNTISFLSLLVGSSVITAVVRHKYFVASELYNITITCAIRPDSIADQCVVMAMDDGGVNKTGNIP